MNTMSPTTAVQTITILVSFMLWTYTRQRRTTTVNTSAVLVINSQQSLSASFETPFPWRHFVLATPFDRRQLQTLCVGYNIRQETTPDPLCYFATLWIVNPCVRCKMWMELLYNQKMYVIDLWLIKVAVSLCYRASNGRMSKWGRIGKNVEAVVA
jgi:hypothetical protein